MKSRQPIHLILTLAIGATIALPALACAQVQTKQRLEVTPDGANIITEYRDANGRVLGQLNKDGGFVDPQDVTSPRWIEEDGGLAWICESVALGDSGAAVMAGKALNNESVALYSTNHPQSIFEFDCLDSESPQVAVADRAPISAAFTVFDLDPSGEYDFEGQVDVFSNTGDGTPAWSYTFPTTLNYYGGGVAVSDNGNVILAWKANPNTSTLLVEAFKGDGTPISSGEVQTEYNGNLNFNSRQTRLSDDGSRAYFFVGVEAVIYDVATGTIEYQHNVGASFDSHAFAGDGKSFAYGYFGYFKVVGETSPGNWDVTDTVYSDGGTYVARLDLNTDGSRVGYQIQRYTPAYDHIEIGMYDVANSNELFNAAYDAPGTSAQLVCAGVQIDELGQYAAGASWGDSGNVTPETFVFDADGNVTCEIDARGSAFAVDIDADGDVAASGHKAVHANEFGNGGDLIVTDTYEQSLHVLGYLAAGRSIDIELTEPGSKVYVAVAMKLNFAGTPLEIALNTRVATLGPYDVPANGLTVPLSLPNIPFVQGNLFHFQAGKMSGGYISNKASIRVQP